MKEKLIRVDGTYFTEIDAYLKDGWTINSISACAAFGDCSVTKSDMQLDINYRKLYEIALIRSSVTDAGICIPAFGFIVPR